MLALTVIAGLSYYPLSPWPLAAALTVYAGVLCWRPVIFLLVMPCALAAWDCGIWTGWMMVDEADFFLLTSVAVLLVRTPPARRDLLPGGLAGIVLVWFVAAWTVSTAIGLLSPLGGEVSSNAFLRPDNAVRLAKGLVAAVVVLPFLSRRQRTDGDAVLWLGWGMAASLVLVALVVLAERSLFPGVLDFSGDYRVAGPVSSMRVGGGHIGAFLALALPLTLCLMRLRPDRLAITLSLAVWVLGGYALVVTFARTAYAAGAFGMIVAGSGWFVASSRHRASAMRGIGLVALILVALAAAAAMTGMRTRIADTARDFLTRQDNWRAGLAVRDNDALTDLVGMGLGGYQRAMLVRSPVNRPSDIAVVADGAGDYVSMRVETPFYLGQKVTFLAIGDLRLTLLARSPQDRTTIRILLCDKVLLYSDHCRGQGVVLGTIDAWQSVTATVSVQGLGAGAWLDMLHRPVELSLSGEPVGRRLDLRDIRLTDSDGRDILANGDFRRGLDHWIFTDDSHVSWRMLNVYLMLWFETGTLGLMGFLALAGVAATGGVRAATQGAVEGAGVAGSVVGFLVCGLFDHVLEAPRLSALFFLIAGCGLLQWADWIRIKVAGIG